MSKILLNGGNGALGVYLTEKLVKMGHTVDVICLEENCENKENVNYIIHDGKDIAFLTELLKNGYDAVVDFMVYITLDGYKPFADLYVNNTKHYLFLSTYRVYAGSYPINEDSPRLLDVKKPDDFVEKYEYSIYKAEEEDYLRSLDNDNWTILRPAITYSKQRFQLTILEANVLMWRIKHNKTVVLPEGAMDCQCTMSWAGDFGKTVSKLILNKEAYREAFTVSTSEHHTWREVAEIYKKICGLKYVTVDNDTFIDEIFDSGILQKQQLQYDRCYNRIIDNSKLLRFSGRKQSEFMPLADGLKMEFEGYDGDLYDEKLNDKMDKLLKKLGIEE